MEEENTQIVTSETAKPSFELVERDLDDDTLTEKKIQLMQAQIHKDKSDMSLAEMEEQLDAKIPLKFLEDDIAKLEKDLANKVTKNDKGEEQPATEADLKYMEIRLKYLKKSVELDIPMRELRLNMHTLRTAKNRYDAPEQQIKKLEKEIRERKETTLSTRTQDGKEIPIGVA